jgi:polyferredoxin
LAGSSLSYGQGVLALFSSTVYSARDIQKIRNYKIDAFEKANTAIGFMKDRITISKKTDQILKYLKYLILIVLIFVWAFGIETTSVSPWHAFGTYISLSGWSDLSTFITIGGWLLLLIMIASLFIERFFCRYPCPPGGIYTVLSRFKSQQDNAENVITVKQSVP